MADPTVGDLVRVDAAPEYLLVDVTTGETLEPSVENAAIVLEAAREMKNRIQGVIRDAEAYLADRSRELGTKTFHHSDDLGQFDVVLTGGTSVSYDPVALREALEAADCPEGRINEVVVRTYTDRVDGRILRQLIAANPNYKAAAELAEIREEKPLRASVKRGARL